MKIWRQVPANAMSIFSSNSAFKLEIHLQCRALIIPWAKMKVGCIKCSNERDFSSSFPVRYIPRKNVEYGESKGLSPAKVTEPSYSSNEQSSRDVCRPELSRNRLIPDSTQTYRVESKSLNESMNFAVGLGIGKAINCEEDSILEESKNELLVSRAEMKVGCIKYSNERDFSSSLYISGKNVEPGESERINPAKVTQPSYSSNEQSSRDVGRAEFSRNRLIPDSTQTYRVESKSQNESMNFGVGLGVGKAINCQEQFEDDRILEEPEEYMHEVKLSEEEEQSEEYSLFQGNSIIQQDVENLAVKILAKRAFTAFELRKKLLAKHFPRVIVDAVILDFQKRGLVNDSLYAETYSRSRWSTSTWGPRRIKKALMDKGVKNEVVDKAVKLALNDSNSAADEESALGMSQDAMNHLFVQASKQWLRSVDMPREKRKSRIIGWLQYRGFNWNIICNVLKKLESGHHL